MEKNQSARSQRKSPDTMPRMRRISPVGREAGVDMKPGGMRERACVPRERKAAEV